MNYISYSKDSTELFNKILKDIQSIKSDEDLKKREILYNDYKVFYRVLDILKSTGEVMIKGRHMINYFKNLGCTIEHTDGDIWFRVKI